jgi:hypothetical protein
MFGSDNEVIEEVAANTKFTLVQEDGWMFLFLAAARLLS